MITSKKLYLTFAIIDRLTILTKNNGEIALGCTV